MSTETNVKDLEKNGVEVTGKKGAKNKRPCIVKLTQTELVQVAPPTDKDGNAMKSYCVVATKDVKAGEVLGYTYEYNPRSAVLNVVFDKSVSAKKLDKLPSFQNILADLAMMEASGLDLPEPLRKFVAEQNAKSHLAPTPPKGSHKK